MSQLGFDEDGDPIDLPPMAVGWRVRRMTGKRGAPGLVYGSSGVPGDAGAGGSGCSTGREKGADVPTDVPRVRGQVHDGVSAAPEAH
jgi:hypothetical protein